MATEQQVKMAARLYECRDAARTLFGARYEAEIAPRRQLIRDAMTHHKIEALPAARQLIDVAGLSGISIVTMMAAAVDVVEGVQP